MARPESVGIENLSDVRLRVETARVGAQFIYVVFGVGLIYAVATWSSPDRTVLAGLLALWALVAFGVDRLPMERIVRSRYREPFFLAWSVFSVAMVGALVGVDGGVRSPLALLFFLPLIFAALSYPLGSVVVVGTLSELTLVGVAIAGGITSEGSDRVELGFFAGTLAVAAVLCAWQAQNQDRRREELLVVSRTDPLTGSLNRRGFSERLAAELDQALRTGRPLSVVMIDLDNFKRVNDTEGHAGGDELLCWTVERIAEVARPMDSLGRVGGDEFAFAVPGAGHADGQKVAERLRDALASRVAISTGVGAFPAHGVDAGEVLRHADQELYAAKKGERPAQTQAPGRRELSWGAALARAVDMRSAMAGDHSDRVVSYAAAIADRLGWSGPELARLRMAAMLHDVGKVGLPDSVLSKPGRLREDVFAQVKEHPVTGAQLVARVEGLDPIIPWIRYSHEHLDGSGYPEGLVGEEIPLASRILLVADAFDAMTTPRPYRAAVSPEEGLEELRRCAGTHFDPRCVDALAQHLREHAVSVEG